MFSHAPAGEVHGWLGAGARDAPATPREAADASDKEYPLEKKRIMWEPARSASSAGTSQPYKRLTSTGRLDLDEV